MGTVRIRSTVKKTVWEYAGLRKEDAAEKVAEHLVMYPVDAVPDPAVDDKNRKLDGTGFIPVVVDYSTVIAEWVENAGAKKEKIERLALPTAPK